MRRGNNGVRITKSEGFTLFEMVVVICSIVILYMVAEQRLNELPAAAERASFFAILDQVKISVNFEMVTKLASGRFEELRALEGTNPMDLLLEPPNNYRGELEEVTDRNVERRASWYFENSTGELVYVVGGSSLKDVWVTLGGYQVNYGQIRLKLMNIYREQNGGNAGAGPGIDGRGNWDALLLQPVYPYEWERRPEEPVSIQ